jgi:ketosteroid isomerase-like protein
MTLGRVAVVGFVSGLIVASCTQSPPSASPAATPPAAPAATASGEDVEATIAQLEREWVAAIVKKDTVTIDRLLADEFIGTSPSAHQYTKALALEDLARGTYVVEEMDLDEVSVKPYGDAAVAFASQQEKSRYGGKDIGGHYHYTSVWVKKDGQWQVVTSHGSRYDTPH